MQDYNQNEFTTEYAKIAEKFFPSALQTCKTVFF